MNEADRKIITALHRGIPMTETPFDDIAREAGVSVGELLAKIEAWKADGTIRRFGAILRHMTAGYPVNAMTVWNVPDDQADAFGEIASGSRSVSHCYMRPRFEGFDYNLYTMIHGKSREDCEAAVREISQATGITDYAMLYTTAEFKKTSPTL